MKATVALVLSLVAAFIPAALMGQDQVCPDSHTVDECGARIDTLLAADAAEARVAAAEASGEARLEAEKEELARKPTGTTALGTGLASTINDFLPALAGALGFTPTTTDDNAAAFETNLRLPLGAALQKVRLQVVLREPELYEPLRAALPEATREERSDVLGRELRDFDDVRLSIAWNLESRALGRSFESHRSAYDQLFATQRSEFFRRPGTVAEALRRRREADEAYAAWRKTIDESSLDPAQNCTLPRIALGELELRCLKQEVKDQFIGVFEDAVRAMQAVEGALDDQLENTGFYDLPDLVNNQPQLSAQLAVDVRRDLAGPNEVSATLRYEAGFTNMNGLRRACERQGQTITLDCLRSYTKNPGKQASLKRGDRFFVTASFARRQDYAIALADDGVNLTLEGTWDLTGELGYGRYVACNREGEQIGRIDLSAQYVHHEDDPTRQNRFVGTATYTQRVSESLSLAAGFSYANNPEFLGDVDRKVTANFGLRYKLLND